MKKSLGSTNIIETDVLVVGGGIAGCFSAIEAKKRLADVVLVDKGNTGRSGLSPLMSGVLTYFDPDVDDLDSWLVNCVKVGEYLSEQEILRETIGETTNVVRDLSSWGAEFATKSGKIERFKSVAGATNVKMSKGGIQLMDVVRGEVIRRGVRLVERVAILHLLTSDGERPTCGQVVGALGIHVRTGKLYIFKAKAIIIATGCVGFKRYGLLSPFVHSANGIMMGFRAGCQLINLELTLAFSVPADFNIAGSALVLGQGAYLVNEKGERIMKRYEPVRMEKASKNLTAVAIAKEYLENRGPIFLDARHLSSEAHEAIRKGIPIFTKVLQKAGLDLQNDLLRYENMCAPCIGAGGIRVDKARASTLPGLYAAGSAGDHPEDGADATISHGMQSAVGGRVAGRSAAEYALEVKEPVIVENQIQTTAEEVLRLIGRSKGITGYSINEEIGKIWTPIEIVRSGKSLSTAIEKLKVVKVDKIPKLYAEDSHMLIVALGAIDKISALELLCNSALVRTESRGGHFREDYPHRDDKNWLCWVVCQQTDNGIKFWTEPVPFQKYPVEPPL